MAMFICSRCKCRAGFNNAPKGKPKLCVSCGKKANSTTNPAPFGLLERFVMWREIRKKEKFLKNNDWHKYGGLWHSPYISSNKLSLNFAYEYELLLHETI